MVYDEGFEVAIDKQRVCFLFSSTVVVVTFLSCCNFSFFLQIVDSVLTMCMFRQFFAFFAYTPKSSASLSNIKVENYNSFCSQTLVGHYHDIADKPQNWGCYRAQKVGVKPFVLPGWCIHLLGLVIIWSTST